MQPMFQMPTINNINNPQYLLGLTTVFDKEYITSILKWQNIFERPSNKPLFLLNKIFVTRHSTKTKATNINNKLANISRAPG
jgi:hypothetical protein